MWPVRLAPRRWDVIDAGLPQSYARFRWSTAFRATAAPGAPSETDAQRIDAARARNALDQALSTALGHDYEPSSYAATSPDAKRGGFYGPRGPGHLGGPPAEQKLYSRLRSTEDAQRIWHLSEELMKVPIPNG